LARGIGLALAVCLALAGGAGGEAAAKGSADVQWAQQVLKDKGFDVGKPNGEMTPKTRAALSSFQRISGLMVTGDLDAATTAKLLAGRPEPAGGGMLGVPPPSQARQPARDAAPPKPHAAPAARIEALGGPGGEAVISSAGGGVSGGSVSASGGAPAPKAAPSGAVSALATGALPGQAPMAVKDNGDTEGPVAIAAAGWVRDLVVGVIVAILGGFAVLWWLSGRKPAHRHPVRGAGRGRDHHGGERREPSFAPPASSRGDRELRVRRL